MTHRRKAEHRRHDGPVKALDARDGVVATGGADRVVLVGALDGEAVASDVHGDIVNDVRLRGDGRVASASKDGAVRVVEPDGRTTAVGHHDHWAMGVAWDPDGDAVASTSEDATVRVWDVASREERWRRDLDRPANAVDWRGDTVAVATGDRRLLLVEPADGSVRRDVPGARQLLWSVALSADGARAAWVGRDRYVRVVDVDGGDPVVFPAHRDQIWSVRWAGSDLLTASADGTVGRWGADGTPLERVDVGPWARIAVATGSGLLVATEDGTVVEFHDDGEPADAGAVEVPQPPDACAHWDPQVTDTERGVCEECDATEELRLCVTCGHVGCCESQLAHGTKHWEETGHPNTVPVRAEFPWRWCYADDIYVKRTT